MTALFDKIQKSAFFKKARLGISISILMGLIAVLFFLFTFTSRSLFSGNKHFTLKNIVIKGTAVWAAREQQILEYGRIVKGQSNLFEINIRELRKKIEALPSVEKAFVSRQLPNTLIISIIERIPRLAFRTGGRTWYADDHGVVFSASSYGAVRRDLPLIVGFTVKSELAEGDTIDEFIYPAEIAAHCARFYPDFSIIRFDMSSANYIVAKIRYIENDEIYTVIFPYEKLTEKFAAFKWALRKSLDDKTGKKIFDLRFEAQVVTR